MLQMCHVCVCIELTTAENPAVMENVLLWENPQQEIPVWNSCSHQHACLALAQ